MKSANQRALEARTFASRRQFLRGVGVTLALPAFASMRVPALAAAAPLPASGPSGAPVRMAFVYFPNGAVPKAWWPEAEGADFKLNRTMESLESLKHQIQVIGGLDHKGGYPGPDGPGDHARASGGYLTGVRVKKTAGADVEANISIDQVVAQQVGHLTRFPSLELSCDAVRKSGNCDSGYSCAYQYNLAWSTPKTPISPEPNPRLVFERLFGAGSRADRQANFKRRQAEQQSILDFVTEDARALDKKLGGEDQRKLDEYLASVREIEKRIERAEQHGEIPNPDAETPAGIPPSFQEHIRLMYSILVLAFQTDSTRVATLLLANDGANRTFPEIDIIEGHHYLTHHRGQKDMIEKVTQIDRFYVDQFAWFLQQLDAVKDIDGNSLLHNSMLLYGGGIADGNRHTHDNLPLILAGSGGGKLNPGRYYKASSQPISNLFLSMADRMGATGVERHGDSTGRFEAI